MKPPRNLWIFCQVVKISEKIRIVATGREKVIHCSYKLQDDLLKGITDLSVIQYSNWCYKPYNLKAHRELENSKRR